MKRVLFSAAATTLMISSLHAQNAQPPAAAPNVNWQPVALVSAAQKPSVKIGGEGAQWGRAVAMDNSGQFMLWGTDVGGLFRSLNGGQTWEPCNVGYTPRGTAGLAIDPNNSKRVLSIGANSVTTDQQHGVWISTDGASSWRQTFKANISGSHDNREQLAFDASNYDQENQRTRYVYWSRVADDQPMWGDVDLHPALYKSSDGGETWAEMPNTTQIGGSILRVASRRGTVYAANPNGFFRSDDGGKTWEKTLEGDATGVDVCAKTPGAVWVSKVDGVYLSTDFGRTFHVLPASLDLGGKDQVVRNIHVSHSDARRLLLWREAPDWAWSRWVSSDGGESWSEVKLDKSRQFLPTNARQGLFAWSPSDPDIVLSTGGDYPTLSRDGGRTFSWTGDGVNNILVGGSLAFNAGNPDVMFVGSQDYNGASTTDGGQTWTYQNPSGNGWGGFTYGGYAATPGVMFVGNSSGWGDKRELTVTRDGGKTWTKTGHQFSGPDASYGDPQNPQVLFASNWRSADNAQTWAEMTGCDAVLTHDPKTSALYGVKKLKVDGKDAAQIVTSSDIGQNWKIVTQLAGKTDDVAVDPRGTLFAVNDGALQTFADNAWRKIEGLPRDQWGEPRVKSVAVDPQNPDVIYLATNRDVFASFASVLRSVDGGKTWQNLTRQTPLDGTAKDGGREAFWVRVHPKTREAWVATSCYGIWKVAAPR